MKSNVGGIDRILRIVIGLVLIGLTLTGTIGVWGWIGVVPLATALLGRGTHLALTHQALADELGTVREIVSRLLRRFEREGWVSLSRERIQIADSAALRAVAAGQPV